MFSWFHRSVKGCYSYFEVNMFQILKVATATKETSTDRIVDDCEFLS